MNLNKKNMKNMMLLITFAAFMLWLVFNYESFINLLLFIIELFFPILLGIAIAFVINVPMKLIERKIFKVEIRKKKKLIRIISLILSHIIIYLHRGLYSHPDENKGENAENHKSIIDTPDQ